MGAGPAAAAGASGAAQQALPAGPSARPAPASAPPANELPQARSREFLRARLFLRAALPCVKVMLEDDPATAKRFKHVDAVVQFVAKNQPRAVGAYLRFENGDVRVEQGFWDADGSGREPDITFTFGSLARLCDFFAGKTVLPSIRGYNHPALLAKVLRLLLSLKLMLPSSQPTDPARRRLKLKLTLYMITTALSQYNKGGDPGMQRWTAKQPDRIYQFSVEPEGIAAYLRVRGGQTKAGRGVYRRRRPFVHMRFNGVDGALAVMNKDVEFVEGVGKGMVRIDGSPEYAANLNDYMMRVQALLTG
jgi:hypothetical protein